MSIKTTKPVEDAAKLGGKLPGEYAAENYKKDILTLYDVKTDIENCKAAWLDGNTVFVNIRVVAQTKDGIANTKAFARIPDSIPAPKSAMYVVSVVTKADGSFVPGYATVGVNAGDRRLIQYYASISTNCNSITASFCYPVE